MPHGMWDLSSQPGIEPPAKSPVLFLILVIFIFSPIFVSLARDLLILLVFLKKRDQKFVSLLFFYCFSLSLFFLNHFMTQVMVYLGALNISYMLEKHVYMFSSGVECSVNVRSFWLIGLFRWSISLLIFCLLVLLIIESRVLKSPSIIVHLFISLFCYFCFCFRYFEYLLLGTYALRALSFLSQLTLFSFCNYPLYP